MMSWRPHHTRIALRWFHIVASIALAIYIYAPWQSVWAFEVGIKCVLVPALVLTGLGMWKQAMIRRLLRRR